MAKPVSYGWYDYLDDKGSMANRLSDQRLMFENWLEMDTNEENLEDWSQRADFEGHKRKRTASRFPKIHLYKYAYQDPEINLTIVFQFMNEILLDYHDIFTSVPSYGLWRRVDDFLTDALTCWYSPISQRTHRLVIKGGYHKGKWDSSFRRIFSADIRHRADESDRSKICSPYMIPLDRKIPAQWTYNDCLPPHQISELESTYDETFGIHRLKDNKILPQIEGKVPYLSRDDGQAFVFPCECSLSSGRGHGAVSRIYYTYIDDGIFFTFEANNTYQIKLGGVKSYGLRSMPPQKSFFPADMYGVAYEGLNCFVSQKFVNLNHRIYLDFAHTLLDAWFIWGDKKMDDVRELISPEVIEQQQKGAPKVYAGDFGYNMKGGFTAGCSDASRSLVHTMKPWRRIK